MGKYNKAENRGKNKNKNFNFRKKRKQFLNFNGMTANDTFL